MASPTVAQAEALEFKNKGNTAHQAADYRQAVFWFTKGLELNAGAPLDYLLYSNRSAAYCLLGDHKRALNDADTVIKLQPNWPKGFSRKAVALQNLKQYTEAIKAYEAGLELDDGNQVMLRGLQEAKTLKIQHEGKPFDKTITAETKETMQHLQHMNQLRDVVWHLEILKDKIWLADPPKPPFRPRSLFLIDSTRVQMLHMAAHPTRDSISLDELLDFISQACFKHGVLPRILEFSDYRLEVALADSLKDLNVEVRTLELSKAKERFFDETVRSFEEREQEQWTDNPKFEGVLRQRNQKGLLSIPGCTPFFLKYLLAAAASFYQSKVFMYFTKSLGLYIQGTDEHSTVLITRNSLGQFGIAKSSLDSAKSMKDCGEASYLFSEFSNVPFEDVDLIEKHGWEIAEEKYPLPLQHAKQPGMHRPTLHQLKWFELAFRCTTLFLEHTWAKPTYVHEGPLCYRCVVHTHAGKASAIITAPPSTNTAVDVTLEEPPPPPPRERLLHKPPTSSNNGGPAGDKAAGDPAHSSPPKPQPEPKEEPVPITKSKRTSTNKLVGPTPATPPKPTTSTTTSTVNTGTTGGGSRLSTSSGATRTDWRSPTAASKPKAYEGSPSVASKGRPSPPVSPRHEREGEREFGSAQRGSSHGVESQVNSKHSAPLLSRATSSHRYLSASNKNQANNKWRIEQHKLAEMRSQWIAEQTSKQSLLNQTSKWMTRLYNENCKLKQTLSDHGQLVGDVKGVLRERDDKVKWQAEHMKTQEAMIKQLQDRVHELEGLNKQLLRDAENKAYHHKKLAEAAERHHSTADSHSKSPLGKSHSSPMAHGGDSDKGSTMGASITPHNSRNSGNLPPPIITPSPNHHALHSRSSISPHREPVQRRQSHQDSEAGSQTSHNSVPPPHPLKVSPQPHQQSTSGVNLMAGATLSGQATLQGMQIQPTLTTSPNPNEMYYRMTMTASDGGAYAGFRRASGAMAAQMQTTPIQAAPMYSLVATNPPVTAFLPQQVRASTPTDAPSGMYWSTATYIPG